MLKSVVFDLDGVIVDSHPAHMRAWKRHHLVRFENSFFSPEPRPSAGEYVRHEE